MPATIEMARLHSGLGVTSNDSGGPSAKQIMNASEGLDAQHSPGILHGRVVLGAVALQELDDGLLPGWDSDVQRRPALSNRQLLTAGPHPEWIWS